MKKLNKIKPLVLFSPLLLSGCFDDNAEQCQKLFNDESMRSLAFSYCENAANNGDANAQFNVAMLFLAENNTEKAVTFLEKSANQKNGQAAYQLGKIYEGNADLEKASFYYEEGCKQGELKACERSRALLKKQNEKNKADQIALEQAKAKTLAEEKAKLEAQAKAQEQQRLNEEAKQRKAEVDAIKARAKGRKFRYGLAKYQDGALWGHINQDGKIVITPQWAYAADFYDGLAAVKTTEGLWGFIDTSGYYKIRPQFYCVYRFTEGLAAVAISGYGEHCQGGKWGFINKNGQWVINPVLDGIKDVFKNGIAKVIYNGYAVDMNTMGQWSYSQD